MSVADKKETLRKISKKVKRLRKENNLTQFQLSINAELDIRIIQRLEVGETDVRVSTIVKLANGFNLSLSEFLDFSKE